MFATKTQNFTASYSKCVWQCSQAICLIWILKVNCFRKHIKLETKMGRPRKANIGQNVTWNILWKIPKIRTKRSGKLFHPENKQWLMTDLQHRFIFELVFNQCLASHSRFACFIAAACRILVHVVIALSYFFGWKTEGKPELKDLSRCQNVWKKRRL